MEFFRWESEIPFNDSTEESFENFLSLKLCVCVSPTKIMKDIKYLSWLPGISSPYGYSGQPVPNSLSLSNQQIIYFCK